MNDLLIVKVAKPINELVDKILSLRNRQSFSLFDEIEHILTKKYYYPITTEFQQHVDIILIFKGPL